MISAGTGLGRGTAIHVPSAFVARTIPTEDVLQSIADFGITRDDIKRLEPTCSELSEIYSAIKAYKAGVKYLRRLRARSRLGTWQKMQFA